jgi:integrase
MARGHIRRRGARSWELKFDLERDPTNGKRAIRFHNVKGTKRDAEKKLAELISAAESGNAVDPSKATLGEFLDRWQRDWAAINVSPKTAERYGDLIRCHVRPCLGAAKLQKLKPIHFAELYAKLLREGRMVRKGADDEKKKATIAPLGSRTVGHVHRLLHRALGHAVQWSLLAVNPVATIDPPKVEGTEIQILTEEQARDVLQKLRGRELYPIALLGLATGMRRGELLALRWRDVDLDGGKLRVEQSLEQTRPRPGAANDLSKRGLRFKPPKTKHGRRTISIPPSIVAELRAHWKAQQEMRLKLGLGKTLDEALVFPNWDGSPRNPNTTTTEWKKATATLGMPRVTLHALRHTHASQLIASGMDVLTVSRRLGHGSPIITLGVYGHLFANTDDRAAQLVEAAFAKVLTDTE